MLSDSPPDRDLEWTDAGVDGAWRYLNRLWRLVAERAPRLAAAGRRRRAGAPRRKALKRLVHRTIAQVTGELERLHFNKAVALVRELSNAVEAFAPGERRRPGAAARGPGDRGRCCSGPMVPHLAEELWQLLGPRAAPGRDRPGPRPIRPGSPPIR